jgi:predicted ribosome quality control (RQC) complex YloA/Tae2 family protein
VLLGKLRRRRKTLVKTLAEWRTHVPDDRHIILAERTASALQEQLWSLENNSVVVTMDDGTTEFVELNPDLSPGANMTAAFTKARKLRRAKEMGEVRTIKLEDNLQIIDQLLNDKTIPFDTLVFKAKQLGIKIDAPRPQTQTKARETTARLFLLQDHCIYVARSSHEGDELVKKAKSNDIWLHVAGGGHGAHVIVPFKKNLDLSDMTGVLRSAAILALHFSDLKNNLSGEVYMSRRAQLRKTKGLPPGKWLMNAVETRKITYDENERDQIFKSQQNL